MKRIVAILSFLVVMIASVCLFACATDVPGGQPTEKITVKIAGQTANEDGSYSVTLKEEESKSFTLVIGTLTDYEFEASASNENVEATVTATSLMLKGKQKGEATITMTEVNEKINELIVKVTVEDEAADVIAPTSVNLSGATAGVGEIDDPFTVEFSAGKTSVHNLAIRPAEASTQFNWVVGSIEGGVFTADEESALTVAQNEIQLTLSCAQGGVYAIEGTGAGDYKVYIVANVTEYTALTAIETQSLTESEDEEYDYYFKTAKGTSWDMTNGPTGRAIAMANGEVFSGRQIPLNQTYFPSLYKIVLNAVPSNATDSVWVMEYSNEGIFTLNADGNWTADAAGSTVITVSNVSQEASITIKVDVVDTIYPGVLTEEFQADEANEEGYWYFDKNPDDYDYTKAMLEDWHLVMNKTTGDPDGADGNQKMFYLGNADRVYGICLETRIDSSVGNSAGAITALTWAKAKIPATATSLTASIGNNDKVFGKYRITLVTEDGEAYCITGGWIEKNKANDDGKPFVDYQIPNEVKGEVVAIVVESSLGEADNNCELHVKGVWINQYQGVESVELGAASASVGQGGNYQIEATVKPAEASYKTVTYAVTGYPEGQANDKVTVDASGKISIAADAPIGEYEITVTSTDNEEANATFTLNVIEYVALTQFNATLSLAGREIAYGAQSLNGAVINATYDANGVYTDSALQLAFNWNENASVTTYQIAYTVENVVKVEGGKLVFVGAGSTEVTITPDDNAALAISFTVNVSEFSEASLIPGTKITATSVLMMTADASTEWNNAAGMKKFVYNTVDRRHGNAKFNYDGNVMQFESHTVEANYVQAVNVGYGVVALASEAKYFNFQVHAHNDDRYLESSNVRVRIAYMNGAECIVDTLLNWTTVANRWKQQEEWFKLSVDVSAYAGKEVLIIFEMAGGLQNNGNFPMGSDSAAGGYLYLGNMSVTAQPAEGSTLPVDGNVTNEQLYRMYANASVGADGWNVSASGKAGDGKGSYANGAYAPLTLTYTGSLAEIITLKLTTTTFYSNTVQSALYPWGVFPALNNGETGTIALASSNEEIFTVVDGVITPVANGEAYLIVKAFTIGSTENTVTFKVKVIVDAVSLKVEANENNVTVEAGNNYSLSYFTVPSNQNVTFSVVEHPEGAVEGTYEVTQEGLFVTQRTAALGKYVVRIAMAEDESVYTDVTVNLSMVTVWDGKNAILDANTGWTNHGGYDAGVGEGADLNKAGAYWYKTMTIGEASQLTYTVRLFARSGETNPIIYVSVVDGEVETRLGVFGTAQTTVEIESDPAKGGNDDSKVFTYLLSDYVGKTVEVRIGIDQGTHCVFQKIELSKHDVTSWANKAAIIDANTGWSLNGNWHEGVGEGADLTGAGSYWYRNVSLYGVTKLTVNARVFVRGGETNPVMYVSVFVDGVETRITADGEAANTVTLDTTNPKYDSPNAWVYDLSAYAGKTVQIRIGIDQGTHCVITSVNLSK